MKLNSVPNFRVEDFQSEQSWIGRLFIQLNPFVQAVNQVCDQNVDFATNIKSVTREFTFTSFQPISFQWPYSDKPPNDLRVTQALKGTQQTPTILLAAWEYDATDTAITVTKLIELSELGVISLAGRYQIKIRANV